MSEKVNGMGWAGIDYRPAIADLPPEPVAQHVPPGSLVLDIGCNTARNAFFLAQRGFRVLGIDVNVAAIDEARRRAEEIGATASVECRAGDILEEQFTEQFEVVMLIRVLTCFSDAPEWNAVLRRTAELLKPGGYIYIHDFLTAPDIEAYRVRYEAAARVGWRPGNFQVNDGEGRRLFIAHHHSDEEVAAITAGYETLSFRRHESLSLNGNRCRMFEFLGRSLANVRSSA